MTALVPERLATALEGRYRMERELGQGGMATGYLAHDLKHDRKVALKVLKPELAAVLGDGSPEHEIPVHGDLRIAQGVYLTSNAVGADGRIVVQVVPRASWFWPAAMLDPRTGTLDVLPPGPGYGMKGGWSADGHVVYDVRGLQSTLWRFRPVIGSGDRP